MVQILIEVLQLINALLSLCETLSTNLNESVNESAKGGKVANQKGGDYPPPVIGGGCKDRDNLRNGKM